MSATSLTALLLVAVGGATGSVLRYLVTLWSIERLGVGFPWGTLAVNIIGSACIGIAGGLGIGGEARLLLVTGVLGGFTTFSALCAGEPGFRPRRLWALLRPGQARLTQQGGMP